jgi:hypothetical protein
MIKEILKTLSDTEIVVIANEINNPDISNLSIYKQLMGKENDGDVIDSDDFDKLPSSIINELAIRLLK